MTSRFTTARSVDCLMPDGLHSALVPHSDEAAEIAHLALVLFAGGTLIFAAVVALAVLALRRRPAWLAHDRVVAWGGIVVPVVLLTALLVYAARAATPAGGDEVLRVRVVAQQWWWRVHYADDATGAAFETANEIRLPVGRRVELALESVDVLHSFWVPSLAGKLDMVPGRVNRLRITPTGEGTFRGQCAEYCGGPHARMALFVVTMPPAAFERWRELQRMPASRTHALFEARCSVCHAVRGTLSRGSLGPDLTHVASRVSIGAGMLAADRNGFSGWIAHNQSMKPGNLMPAFDDLPASDLDALADYLEALQ